MLVRFQLVDALRVAAQQMQEEVERSTATMDREKTKEQVQAESKVAQLEALRDSGVPGLDTALSALRKEIAVIAAPVASPDWTGLAELLATPGLLERFTDAQLRPLVMEYVAEILYIGNPAQVNIRIREGA